MEKFKVKRTIGGWVTVPVNADNCPLLSALHGGGNTSDRLEWNSLEFGLGEIRASAEGLNISVQVCGDIKRSPTVILRHRGNTEKVEPIYPFDGKECYDACHWGITDFYPENEKALKDAIGTGMPFDTRWYSTKKEIQTGRVSREIKNGPITVEVSACMDEARDLVDTAIWEAAGGNKVCDSGYDYLSKLGFDDDASDKFIDRVADSCNLGEDNCASGYRKLHWNSGYKLVCDALSSEMSAASDSLDSQYENVVRVTKDLIAHFRYDLFESSCSNCIHFIAGTHDTRTHPGDNDECAHPRYDSLFSNNPHFPFRNGCRYWESKNRTRKFPFPDH